MGLPTRKASRNWMSALPDASRNRPLPAIRTERPKPSRQLRPPDSTQAGMSVMKTNHNRSFKANSERTRWRGFRKPKCGKRASVALDGSAINPKGFGFPDGPKDAAKLNHGEKHFERSRFRFHEKNGVRKILKDLDV